MKVRTKHLYAAIIAAVIATAPVVGAAPPEAPAGYLTAIAGERSVIQQGRLVFSTWNGTHYQSRAFRWPAAARISANADITFRITTAKAPQSAEVRIWRRVDRSGIPQGAPVRYSCTPVPIAAAGPGGCRLTVDTSGSGIQWVVHLPPQHARHAYITTTVDWTNERVVWENHVITV